MSETTCAGCGNPVEEKATCGACGTVQGAAPAPAAASTAVDNSAKCPACGNPIGQAPTTCGACGSVFEAPPSESVQALATAESEKKNPSAADLDADAEEKEAAAATETATSTEQGLNNQTLQPEPEIVVAPESGPRGSQVVEIPIDPVLKCTQALIAMGYDAEEAARLANSAKEQIEARKKG